MTLLVDPLREYPDTGLPFSALVPPRLDASFEELHAFAARLGIPRRFFQGDHYDLPAHLRARALELGAVPVSTRELLARMAGPRGDRARRRRRVRNCGWVEVVVVRSADRRAGFRSSSAQREIDWSGTSVADAFRAVDSRVVRTGRKPSPGPCHPPLPSRS